MLHYKNYTSRSRIFARISIHILNAIVSTGYLKKRKKETYIWYVAWNINNVHVAATCDLCRSGIVSHTDSVAPNQHEDPSSLI